MRIHRGAAVLLALVMSSATTTARARVLDYRRHAEVQRCIPWAFVPTTSDPNEALNSIDGLSAQDFWAVGGASVSPHLPVIRHWNGTEWTQPPFEHFPGELRSVDVISASDAWAVGTYSSYNKTVAMHWDGKAWSLVPTPSPSKITATLDGVSALGPSDVWAAGTFGRNKGLIEHWNGATWSLVHDDELPRGDIFHDIVALQPDDVWAVGAQVEPYPKALSPMIQHWDGAEWTNVILPKGSIEAQLLDVDASGPNDVWAVGGVGHAVIYHWDGVAWTRVNRVPFRASGQLFGVSVLAPYDVWVAGIGHNNPIPVAAHWDGRKWTITPVTPENGWLNTVKAFRHTEVWAGGFAVPDGIRAERFEPCPK